MNPIETSRMFELNSTCSDDEIEDNERPESEDMKASYQSIHSKKSKHSTPGYSATVVESLNSRWAQPKYPCQSIIFNSISPEFDSYENFAKRVGRLLIEPKIVTICLSEGKARESLITALSKQGFIVIESFTNDYQLSMQNLNSDKAKIKCAIM
jgi:hypothetical protein